MCDKPRVLLIRAYRNGHTTTLMPPLGLMYLAAYLRRRADLNIKIIDMDPAKVSYENIDKEIREYRPSWLGISALTFESEGLHRVAAIAKGVQPDLTVVAGGPHPSAYTDQVMADLNIDFAVLGEGELTADALDQAIRTEGPVDQIDGLARRENGSVRINPRRRFIEDLDSIPFPAWDLIDIPRYPDYVRMSRCGGIHNYMPIFTTRACPFECIYCHQMFGKGFRMRSPENVLAEIRSLYEKHNIREFEIIDDIFNGDLKRAKQIFDMIYESGMNIRFTLPNAIRGDHADEEFFIKARRAGAVFIAFSVETATPRLQKMIQKNMNLGKIQQNISLARKHGIFCQGLFMLGFPTETREELQATVDFAVNSDLHAAHLFIVNAYEGTELAKLANKMGKPIFNNFKNNYLTSEFTNLTDLPDKELDRIRHRGLMRFWLKPSRVWAIICEYPQKSQFPILLKALIEKLLVRG